MLLASFRTLAQATTVSVVAILLTLDGERFWVEVTPRDADEWRSDQPLTATEVLGVLSKRGCDSTEVIYALDQADPTWSVRHDAEVMRRRAQGA